MKNLLTTTQAAARLAEEMGRHVGASTVRLWCTQGLFPHARAEETPRGRVWLIPESDLKGFKPPRMGRPRKAAGSSSRQEPEEVRSAA